MKGTSRKYIFVAVALLLSACSTVQDFAIVNRSTGEVEVIYKIKRCNPEAIQVFSDSHPAKLPISEFEKPANEWKLLPVDQFVYEACTVKVRVGVDEALRIDREAGYGGPAAENIHSQFNIETLTIAGQNGTIHLEGRQVETTFEEDENGDYFIGYE